MNLLAAVVLVGLLVFVHEFGHFVVAKACRIGVPVFSLGFGRRIFGFRYGRTDYRVSALPFGGYVRLAGADAFGLDEEGDDDAQSDPSASFLRRPVWQRLLVSIAGPASNLALPFAVFTFLLMAGEPRSAPVVGSVNLSTPAWEAGVLAGDEVVSVGGVAVHDWYDVSREVAARGKGRVELRVRRAGAERDLVLDVGDDDLHDAERGMSWMRPSAMTGIDDPDSPAGRAGVRSGDLVREVNGREVKDWSEVNAALEAAGGGSAAPTVVLVVDGEGGRRTLTLERQAGWRPISPGRPLMPSEAWGLVPATLVVGRVSGSVTDAGGILSGCRPRPEEPPPTPASAAGIREGDRFLRLDGRPVLTWADVLASVRGTMEGSPAARAARPLDVELVREGRVVRLALTPTVIEDIDDFGRYYYRPIIGVQGMGSLVGGPEVRKYYSFGAAFARASEETLELGRLIVEQIGKVLTGEASVERSLGGPIEMLRQAGKAAEQGVFAWARLMGILSISLGIVNLLPVPVLDGGQILFYLLEGIRGRPVSIALRERAQQVGVLFLVILMLSVLVLDIHRVVQDMGR